MTRVSVKSGGVAAAEAGFSCKNSSNKHPIKRPATTASRTRRSVREVAVTLVMSKPKIRPEMGIAGRGRVLFIYPTSSLPEALCAQSLRERGDQPRLKLYNVTTLASMRY